MKVMKTIIFLLIFSCFSMFVFSSTVACDLNISSGDIINEEISTETQIKTNMEKNTHTVFRDFIFPMFIEFIGAFLGVLSALALNSHSDKKTSKELEKALKKELQNINKELEKYSSEKEYVYYKYDTTVWDINLAAGNLSLFINSKANKKYIDIYSKIQYAQGLENEYLRMKLLKEEDLDDGIKKYKNTIYKARLRMANEIHKGIEKEVK